MSPKKYTLPNIQLSNNISIPANGLTSFDLNSPHDMNKAISKALAVGCRLFEINANNRNEMLVGKALKNILPNYNMKREDIYVSCKFSPNVYCKEESIVEIFKQLSECYNIEYLDLFLIDFPVVRQIDIDSAWHKMFLRSAWPAVSSLYDNGLIDAIGVANFTIPQLKFIEDSHAVAPMVNQVSWNPYRHDDELYKYCHEENIHLQSLPCGGLSTKELQQDIAIKSIAADLEVTQEQVILAWCLQSQISTISAFKNITHVKDCFDLDFTLSNKHILTLNKLANKKTKHK